MSEDPQVTAQYVTQNDLGKVFNNKYRRWARAFSCSPKKNLRRLRRCSYVGFTATHVRPLNKKRSRRGETMVVNGKQVGAPPDITTPSSKLKGF